MAQTVSNTDDTIDIRDVIARVEELREEFQTAMDENDEGHNLTELSAYVSACRADASAAHAHRLHDEAIELQTLETLLDKCAGNGGDEQWEGVWYPITLIRDSYFRDYAEELAEDIGAINANATWPNNCIDWDRAARELQADYTSVDFDGETYWTR